MTFASDTHLPQLLPAEAYTSHDQFERESTSLFRNAWHCVAQTRDLHKEGAFKTVSLLGHPLILWRTKGEIRCYLNVCSHRHCLLTGKSKGTMPLLKCQYHGWEYDREGDTKRIPDARSFRPHLHLAFLAFVSIELRQLASLYLYRCLQIQGLWMSNLVDSGPTLRIFFQIAGPRC